MGVCGAAEQQPTNRKKSQQGRPALKKADLNASYSVTTGEVDKRIKILQKGFNNELEEMINDYDEDINEYTFGQNKTLLIQAVISCPNVDVIELIMDKGADINCKERQTGNTALFLAALDLKVEFVKQLLKYNPDMSIKNNYDQDIFEFLEFQLVEQRKNNNRELEAKERRRYNQIKKLLRDAAKKNEDEDEENNEENED